MAGGRDIGYVRTTLQETSGEENIGHVLIADVNGDGVTDIVAGFVWFEGPDWTPHPYYPREEGVYIEGTPKWACDLSGNGFVDLIGSRAITYKDRELVWFENPGPGEAGAWKKHLITRDIMYLESLLLADIDGDGRDEMVTVDDGEGKGIRIYDIPDDPRQPDWPWRSVVAEARHGLGVGDLNGNGRLDIVSDFMWYEQTASGGWQEHLLPGPSPEDRGRYTMQSLVYDVDGDGNNDIIFTCAHNYGAYWLESSGGASPSFVLHEILPGEVPSQLHGVAYGDIDGDGDIDIFLGKSQYRHGDPGEQDPLDVFWIELVRSENGVEWVKHALATDLVMGFQPCIADVDGDRKAELIMRGIGLSKRVWTLQYDVTIFSREERENED